MATNKQTRRSFLTTCSAAAVATTFSSAFYLRASDKSGARPPVRDGRGDPAVPAPRIASSSSAAPSVPGGGAGRYHDPRRETPMLTRMPVRPIMYAH